MKPTRWRFGDDPDDVLHLLRQGGIVAIPTESSYGLAVDPTNLEAVAHVFELKGRPGQKPLPVVVASADCLPAGCRLRPGLESRLAALWPSALTLILDLDPQRPIAAAGGAPTLAVRVPGHSRLRELLTMTGPLTATSANRSGASAILDPDAAFELLAGARCPSLFVDGGVLPGGMPSTLVRVDGDRWEILRPGAVPKSAVEAAAGISGAATSTQSSTGFVENSADG